MKPSQFLMIALFSVFVATMACNSKKDDAASGDPSSITTDTTASQNPVITTTTPDGNGQAHYTCTKAGCTGTGAAQGKCPICGTDLVHNPAFHAQVAGTPGSSPINPVQVNPTSGTPGTTSATPTPPPAQNAQGIYHYTCAKGCAGGAAVAGNCAKCGGALAHNQAYHNN